MQMETPLERWSLRQEQSLQRFSQGEAVMRRSYGVERHHIRDLALNMQVGVEYDL